MHAQECQQTPGNALTRSYQGRAAVAAPVRKVGVCVPVERDRQSDGLPETLGEQARARGQQQKTQLWSRHVAEIRGINQVTQLQARGCVISPSPLPTGWLRAD